MEFIGDASSQLQFQEHIYQLAEQGIPFFCSSKLLFQMVEDPESFMAYIDPVVERCRWHGKLNEEDDCQERWVVLPKQPLKAA